MDIKKGYKLVSWNGYQLKSISCERNVCYKPEVPTTARPGCGPLACFDNVDDAVGLMSAMNDYSLQLWECQYVPSDRRSPSGYKLWIRKMSLINGPYDDGISNLPMGTVLAESCTLTRRIDVHLPSGGLGRP